MNDNFKYYIGDGGFGATGLGATNYTNGTVTYCQGTNINSSFRANGGDKANTIFGANSKYSPNSNNSYSLKFGSSGGGGDSTGEAGGGAGVNGPGGQINLYNPGLGCANNMPNILESTGYNGGGNNGGTKREGTLFTTSIPLLVLGGTGAGGDGSHSLKANCGGGGGGSYGNGGGGAPNGRSNSYPIIAGIGGGGGGGGENNEGVNPEGGNGGQGIMVLYYHD